MRIVALTLALPLALTACTPDVQFTDDLDFRFDLRHVGGRDRLDTPYVEGTSVRLTVTSVRNVNNLTVTSASPEVFRIDGQRVDDDALILDCTAVSAGVAELSVTRPNGAVIDGVAIEVGRPDRVALHAAGPVFAVLDESESLSVDPRVVEGGTATFEVRWFDGDDQLFGNGVLEVRDEPGISASTQNTFLFENREWLTVRAGASGVSEVQLITGGRVIDSHLFEVVPAGAITDLAIRGRGETGASEGATISLLGETVDGDGNPILGTELTWHRDGVVERGSGDLYRYTFEPDLPTTELTAELGDLMADRDIRGEGSVGSSNSVGCSTTGRGMFPGLAVFLGLFGLRRRV